MYPPSRQEPLPQQPAADPSRGRSEETLALLENQLLRQHIAAQTQLMHLLTHQLATPLTALRGSVHLLAEPSLEPEQRQEFLELVQEQVHRLQTLLADLAERDLDGHLETHAIGFCLPSLIEEVLTSFAYPATLHFGPHLQDAWGDRWQISQVLVNLVSNAIKYSPNQAPIELGASLQPDGQLQVWVRDRGLGIPLADQPHLFQHFYRVQHPDRQAVAGTGLGLALCKLLVEKQGGKMGFESVHGHGSRFYFTLPVAPSEA